MKFEYFEGEQLSPEWFKLRLGVPTASQLYKWMAVSKRDGVTPLKLRADYEKELMFERTFDRNFEKFVSGAMEDGVMFEDFLRKEYQRVTKNDVERVGAWYNKYFVASPDGRVLEGQKNTGLLEIKLLKDTNFTEVISTNTPFVGSGADHMKQIQGQMFASGEKWTDYVVGNLNTKKFKIIRVEADPEFFKVLEESLKQPLAVEPFSEEKVFDFVDAAPQIEEAPKLDVGF